LRLALMGAASVTLESIMISRRTDDRADNGELVHHRGEFGKLLTDFNAGDICPNRLKLAADFRWRIGLQIEHILVRRTTGQKDHDHRFLQTSLALRSFRSEQLGQRHSAHEQAAKAQKTAAVDSITECVSLLLSPNGQHDATPCCQRGCAA
jgi:hypothetical protein